MFARLFSLGLMLGLSFPLYLGLSPLSAVYAAYPGWSIVAAQYKGPQFRPWSRTERGSAAIQRQTRMHKRTPRSANQTTGRRSSLSADNHRRQQAIFSGQRSGARKAMPITRGQELGLRFRPDDRQSPYGQTLVPQGEGGAGAVSEELMSQFRPAPRKRKPTYEELQAEHAPQPQMMPSVPYPMLPQPPLLYPRAYPMW